MNKVFILSMLLAVVAAEDAASDVPSDVPSDMPSADETPTTSSAFAARALVATAFMAVGSMFL